MIAALTLVALSSAGACEPSLSKGRVETSAPIAVSGKQTDECLDEIGKLLAARARLRLVTAAAVVPDADRVDGKALKQAAHAVEVLAKAGIARELLSAVAPRSEGEPAQLRITYWEAPPPPPVARVLAGDANGQVESTDGSSPSKAETPVRVGDHVSSSKAGRLTLYFADGTFVTLEPSTLLELKAFEGSGDKGAAKLVLTQGAIEVEARHTGDFLVTVEPSPFLGSSAATVTVQTGDVRVTAESNGLRAETLGGTATLGALSLNTGQGARGNEASAHPLAGPPAIESSSWRSSALAWDQVPMATAYQVEVSSSAEFRDGSILSTSQTHATGKSMGTKTFWRVRAIDASGFAGAPSKIFAFEH